MLVAHAEFLRSVFDLGRDEVVRRLKVDSFSRLAVQVHHHESAEVPIVRLDLLKRLQSIFDALKDTRTQDNSQVCNPRLQQKSRPRFIVYKDHCGGYFQRVHKNQAPVCSDEKLETRKTQCKFQYFNHFPTSPTIPLISPNLGKYSIDLFMLNLGNPMTSDDTHGLSEDPSKLVLWKKSRSRKALGDSFEPSPSSSMRCRRETQSW